MGGLGEVCATDSGAGRSMRRIVSLYKSLSDTSAWPSAPTHSHTHFTRSHSTPGWPSQSQQERLSGLDLSLCLQVAEHFK